MTSHGDFATQRRAGEHVIKVLDVQHPAGARLVTATLDAGAEGMSGYLSALRSAGVQLPPELTMVSQHPLAVRHRWVSGPTLVECARTDPPRFVRAIAEILTWVQALAATDARLDTNLANFCLADGQLVLVDVLPPLIPSTRPEPANLFDVLFTALCFDTEVIHHALIGYAARALLRAPVMVGAQPRRQLASLAPSTPDTDVPFPTSWFHARTTLALRALAGDLAPAVTHEFFALTSVRVLRELPETGRAHRLQHVEQTLKELGLR